MFTAHYLPTPTCDATTDEVTGPLAEVIQSILTHWWEDEGMQGVTLTNAKGRPVAFLATTANYNGHSGTVSVADFTDGTMTHYAVVYELDAAGRYLRTEVIGE